MKNSEVSKIWMILPRSIVIVLICTTTYKAVFKGPLPKVYWIFFGTLTYCVHKLMPKCAFFEISWKICPKILSYMYHLCFEIRSYQILIFLTASIALAVLHFTFFSVFTWSVLLNLSQTCRNLHKLAQTCIDLYWNI